MLFLLNIPKEERVSYYVTPPHPLRFIHQSVEPLQRMLLPPLGSTFGRSRIEIEHRPRWCPHGSECPAPSSVQTSTSPASVPPPSHNNPTGFHGRSLPPSLFCDSFASHALGFAACSVGLKKLLYVILNFHIALNFNE